MMSPTPTKNAASAASERRTQGRLSSATNLALIWHRRHNKQPIARRAPGQIGPARGCRPPVVRPAALSPTSTAPRCPRSAIVLRWPHKPRACNFTHRLTAFPGSPHRYETKPWGSGSEQRLSRGRAVRVGPDRKERPTLDGQQFPGRTCRWGGDSSKCRKATVESACRRE
jgi:hypothetical protein